jgi:hypothetical protein
MVEGFAMFDRLWPASLVRALKSSMVSPGLFSGGSSDLDFSNSFPISLIRPARIFVARRRLWLDLLRLGLSRHRLLGRRLQAERRWRRGLRPAGFGSDRQHGCNEAHGRKLRAEWFEHGANLA